jgi:hypothetical protein
MTGDFVTPEVGTRFTPRGFVDASTAAYHADELADRPTLSKSIMQILLNASPAHARHAHPKLNPTFTRVPEEKFDLGTVVHDLFLEGYDRVEVVPFDDWRKNDAKQMRDAARAEGKIPLLIRDAERVEEMLVTVKARLTQLELTPPLFADGKAEQAVVWEDRGVLCRARLDWVRDDLASIDDLKSTSVSANPDSWCRKTMWSVGADLQAAFYARGVEAVTGTRPEFRFVVVETHAPFALSVVSMGPDVLTLADKKIDYALDLWRKCLERDEWPAYSSEVAYAQLPSWIESQWLERELREVAA